MSNVPITYGTGQASIAGDTVASTTYQQIKVVDGTVGGTTPLIVNADGTFNARISGSVATVGGTSGGSVSGTVGASIVGQLPSGTGVLGSIAVLQANNPWVIVGSVYGSGSTIAFQGGPQTTSIVGGASVFQTGTWSVSVAGVVNTAGSVVAFQGSNPWIITGSVQGSFTPSGNQSVSGTVGASIIGQLPGGTAVLGSVAVLQGSNPWIETFSNSSILAVPVGSVITVFQAPSIVGTYSEDAPSATSDKGFLVMGARNDTLSSVTSNDGDYSSHVVGPSGELISVNSPFTKWVQGKGSVFTGVLQPIIAPQGGSIFTYITGVQVANMSANNVLLTLYSGGSVVGFTIAPATGGSNIYYQNALKTFANGDFAASISGVASVYVTAEGFIAKI